jgi:hemolysin III
MASTLYHSLTNERAKRLFRKFDHISIFLLIAGTYTPFCLVTLQGWIGWTLFGIVWACAIVGIVFKSISIGKLEILSTIMYVMMGWVALLAIKPLYNNLSSAGFTLLILGGLCYTAGTLFFVKDKIKYFHSIWHLFVLAGSIFHFFSVITLLG